MIELHIIKTNPTASKMLAIDHLLYIG